MKTYTVTQYGVAHAVSEYESVRTVCGKPRGMNLTHTESTLEQYAATVGAEACMICRSNESSLPSGDPSLHGLPKEG